MLDAADPDFLAVDHIAVAVPDRRRLDLRRVGAGRGFGDAHRLQAQFAPRSSADTGASAPRSRALQRAHVVHLAMAGPELPPARLISSMITEASARPRPNRHFLGESGPPSSGLRQRLDELLRIAARLVDLAMVLRREFRAERAHGFADL